MDQLINILMFSILLISFCYFCSFWFDSPTAAANDLKSSISTSVQKIIDQTEDTENVLVHLNRKNNNFLMNVTESQTFCVDKQPKVFHDIWSTAYVKIKSTKPCMISDGMNLTTLHNSRNNFGATILRFISRFKVNSNDEPCDSEMFVPLHKNHYIHIETLNGELKVKYIYTYVDYRMVFLCIFGGLLYFASSHLAKNAVFHYTSGISIGLIGSLLILLMLLVKIIPRKSVAFVTFMTGTSAWMFFTKRILFHFQEFDDLYKYSFLSYLVFSGFMTFAIIYTKGPIENPKYFDIIEWSLKIMSIILVYMGITIREFFYALMIAFLIVNFSFKLNELTLVNRLSNKFFPKTRKLLTQEEYAREADEFTQKQLRDLQNYCRSPECNSWRIISRLKSPEKFAKFIENENNHVSDEEVSFYDQYNVSNDLIDEDN